MHYNLKHWVRLMTPMAAAAAMLALLSGQALAGHDGDRDDHRHHGGRGGWGHHDGWGRGGGGGWGSGPNVDVYVGPAYPSYGYYAYPPAYGYYGYAPYAYGYYGGYPY